MLMRVLAPGPAVRETLCLAPHRLEWKFSSPLAPQKSYPKFRNPMKSPYSGFPKYFLSKILIFGSLKHFGASATNWSERSVCASTTNLSERKLGNKITSLKCCVLIRSPFALKTSPFALIRSPFTLIRSPFTFIRSPFALIRSPSISFPTSNQNPVRA